MERQGPRAWGISGGTTIGDWPDTSGEAAVLVGEGGGLLRGGGVGPDHHRRHRRLQLGPQLAAGSALS